MCQGSLDRVRHQQRKGYFMLYKRFCGNYKKDRGALPLEMLNDFDTMLLISPAAIGFLQNKPINQIQISLAFQKDMPIQPFQKPLCASTDSRACQTSLFDAEQYPVLLVIPCQVIYNYCNCQTSFHNLYKVLISSETW